MVCAVLLRASGKLAQCNDRHIQLFCHDFQVTGDLTDLLHAVLRALARAHKLQIVDDEQPDVRARRVLIDAADLRLHLRDGDIRRIVQINMGLGQHLGRAGQVLPVRRGEPAGAEGLAVDGRLAGEDAADELVLCHFKAEHGHGHILLFRHVGRDVQSKRGFAHTGTGREDDQVRTAQAREHGVQIIKACGNAQIFIFIGTGDLLQMSIGVDDDAADGRERRGIASRANFINFLFRALQQQVGVCFLSCLLQNGLGRIHQLTHTVFFRDNLHIGVRMRKRGHRFSQLGQVDLGRVLGLKNSGILHRCQKRDKIHRRAACKQAHDLGEYLAVLAGIKHLRAQRLHHFGNDVCVQDRRAQHSLFGLHAVRQVYAE